MAVPCIVKPMLLILQTITLLYYIVTTNKFSTNLNIVHITAARIELENKISDTPEYTYSKNKHYMVV